MDTRTKVAIAILLLITVIAMIPGQIVNAKESCDEIVVDEAGVFGAKIDRVTAEAQKLVNLGVDPRIRTIKTFGSAGNLDNYVDQVQRNCKSWQAADGGYKNNLLVLIVAVNDRKTGLYYGSQWERALGPNWIRIQTDRMNPRFHFGDFAGGFIAGLQEIQRLVDLEIHPLPAATQPQQPPIVVVQPAQSPSPPLDLSGLWRVLMWIVILAGLALVGCFVFSLIKTYLAEQAKRRAAQQKARLAKQATASRITEWDEKVRAVETTLTVLEGQVAAVELQVIKASLKKVQERYDRVAMAYADLGSSAGDPDHPGLTVGEYEAIETVYSKVLDGLQSAETALIEINRQTEEMRRLVTGAPKVLEAARAAINQAQKQITEVTQQGFKTEDAVVLIQKAEAAVGRAEKALKDRCFQAVQTAADEAQSMANEAAKSASELSQQKQQADRAIADLEQRIETVKANIVTGREIFESIVATYAQSCWTSIRGNGTEAENRINWSLQALEVAHDLASMEKQEWSKAQERIAKVNSWLDEAESMMRSITARKQGLEAAKRDAPREIQAAQADITKACEYIKTYDADIRDSLETDLATAQKALEKAIAEFEKTMPDYIVVVKLARDANQAADNILVEARSEHEAAERLRQQATSALRDGGRACSKVREYIEDHSSDVGRTAKNKLDDAEKFLAQAKRITDLNQKVKLAQNAEATADSAYSEAESDVDEAEKARYTAVVGYSGWGLSSPYHGGGDTSSHRDDDDTSSGGSLAWGSSGGSGGSFDFGSSGGGGGSIDFGTSGGGGGGSTGW